MVFLRFGVVIAIAWLGYHFGTPIALKDQWPLYDTLRNTTSIVFGIMGALIALVYPDAVKNALRGGSSATPTDGGLRKLISPCGHSALLLVILVILAPAIAWITTLNPTDFAAEIATLQKVSFSLFCVLSYWQVVILLMVLIPFDDLYSKINGDIRRARMRREMHMNGQG
jgi:hypothetical protein